MANTVYGFGVINDHVNQFSSGICPVGHVSDYVRTFVKYGLTHTENSIPETSVFIMASKDDNGDEYVYHTTVKDAMLIFSKGVTAFNDDPLITQLETLALTMGVTIENVGATVSYNGNVYPSWVIFSMDANGETVHVKLWFSDEHIRSEWPFYEIDIISPYVDPIVLYDTYLVVNSLVDDVDVSDLLDRTLEAQNEEPATKASIKQISWRDRLDNSKTKKITFGYLAYGPRALLSTNIDIAWRDYLLNNTTKTLEEWVEYFPSIDNVNGYLIIPMWHKPANIAFGTEVSYYGSIIGLKELEDNILPVAIGHDKPFNDDERNRSETTCHHYKSIGLSILGDATNAPEILAFSDLCPKWEIFGVNNGNLGIVPERTRNINNLIETILRAAEIDDGTQVLDVGLARATFGDNSLDVIEGYVESFLFRVVTKTSWLNAYS